MIFNSKILIVDDNPLNIKCLAARLSSEKYNIIQSYNGQDAVEKAHRELPDLILLDNMIPGLDGYEVTKTLKNNPRTNDIPIILITSRYRANDKVKGLESGADEFLNKPVDPSELRARIKSLLSLKCYRDQLQARIQSEKEFSILSESDKTVKEKTILLVEDDDVAVKLVLNYLKDEPYKIELSTNGTDAIHLAEQEKVDVILLDILLPGMDGFEVCQYLKERPQTRNTQIVIITCLRDIGSKVQGIELGVDDFLVKPVSREILIARINALLKKKDYLDQLTFEHEKALHSAIIDKLTGLHNHGYFEQFLKLEIERSLRQNHPLSLMLLDIDDFKEYNDTLGHLTGNQILRELSLLITSHIRKIDLAARYGGEEFAVVLTYTDTKGAVMVAERLRQAIETHSFSYKTSLLSKSLTVSIGIAGFQSDVTTLEALIERSDMALYKAKKEGKNRVCVFDLAS